MTQLYNLARMTTSTTGTGTITLGSAVSGHLTFANAGVSDGDVISYAIADGSNAEVGTGTYTSSGPTLTRSVEHSTNSDAAINLSGSAEVFISPMARQLQWSYMAPQATTSGTAVDFTSIPAGTSEIELVFEGVSVSGVDDLLVQIGDSGGFETSGYTASGLFVVSAGSSAAGISSTSGFAVHVGLASHSLFGVFRLTRYDSSGVDWVAMHGIATTSSTLAGGGAKTLSGELDRIRITPTGSNTFDAGQLALRYR